MRRDNLRLAQTAYSRKSLDSALSASASQQLLIHSITAYNSGAGAADVGIGTSINDSQWKLYSLRVADADQTATIQAGTAVSLFTTVNNEGAMFQAKNKFGLVSFNVSQIQTGSPVYAYTYWNGASWASLTLLNTPSYLSTGVVCLAFNPPVDWAVGDGSEGGDESMYSIRAIASTAPSQAVQINSLKIVQLMAFRSSVGSDCSMCVLFSTKQFLLQAGESVIPYFSTADTNNTIEVAYQISP